MRLCLQKIAEREVYKVDQFNVVDQQQIYLSLSNCTFGKKMLETKQQQVNKERKKEREEKKKKRLAQMGCVSVCV